MDEPPSMVCIYLSPSFWHYNSQRSVNWLNSVRYRIAPIKTVWRHWNSFTFWGTLHCQHLSTDLTTKEVLDLSKCKRIPTLSYAWMLSKTMFGCPELPKNYQTQEWYLSNIMLNIVSQGIRITWCGKPNDDAISLQYVDGLFHTFRVKLVLVYYWILYHSI